MATTTTNIQVGTGRVHRMRADLLGTYIALCGRTLSGAHVTDAFVNCKACWRAGQG
jgi:hypothetical protein